MSILLDKDARKHIQYPTNIFKLTGRVSKVLQVLLDNQFPMYVKENLLRNIVKMIIKKITKITLIGTDNTSMILFEYVQKILRALLFRGAAIGSHVFWTQSFFRPHLTWVVNNSPLKFNIFYPARLIFRFLNGLVNLQNVSLHSCFCPLS